MKLAVALIVATIIFGFGIKKMVTELAIYKTSEERRERQIFPMLFAETLLYIIFVVQTTSLSMRGILPLL